jgi:hypothetical protein
MTPPEADVLLVLFQHAESQTALQIGHALGRPAQWVTPKLDALLNQGYVKRSAKGEYEPCLKPLEGKHHYPFMSMQLADWVIFKSDYHPKLPAQVKELLGFFQPALKVWILPIHQIKKATEIYTALFGDIKSELVSVEIKLADVRQSLLYDKDKSKNVVVYLMGRQLLVLSGSHVRMGKGVEFKSPAGKPIQCVNQELQWHEDTVLIMNEVSTSWLSHAALTGAINRIHPQNETTLPPQSESKTSLPPDYVTHSFDLANEKTDALTQAWNEREREMESVQLLNAQMNEKMTRLKELDAKIMELTRRSIAETRLTKNQPRDS